MFEQKITLKTKSNQPIIALVNRPQKSAQYPTVIIQHGFKGFKEQPHLKAVSFGLVKSGFQTIRPDLTNSPGESHLDFRHLTLSKLIKNFQAVVDFTLNLVSTDQNNLGLLGFSQGGLIVINQATKNQKIKAVLSVAGTFNPLELWQKRFTASGFALAKKRGYFIIYSDDLKKNLKLDYSFYLHLKNHSLPKNLKKITCPVLILQGSKDQSVPISHSKQYQKQIKNCQLRIIKDADHSFLANSKITAQMVNHSVKFFKKHLTS